MILSAAYALWLYRKVVFGALVKPSLMSIKDLTFRECLTLFPLVALTLLFGVYPKPVLDMSAASVQQLVNNYNTAVTAVKAAALLNRVKAFAMSFSSAGYQLQPVLPELVLAVGAMVLLMIGAYRGQGDDEARHHACRHAPGHHRCARIAAAGRQARDLRRQLHRR